MISSSNKISSYLEWTVTPRIDVFYDIGIGLGLEFEIFPRESMLMNSRLTAYLLLIRSSIYLAYSPCTGRHVPTDTQIMSVLSVARNDQLHGVTKCIPHLGNVWVFKNYQEEIFTQDHHKYCDSLTYYFSFWSIICTYIIVLAILATLCCVLLYAECAVESLFGAKPTS